MNKKILIGSIIAVAILIGVSFTSVVGYSSVKSNLKASPLFTVRTKRAIDEESKDLTCEYVGKGESSVLSIPKRDSRATLIQNVLNKVKRMDDRTFDWFLDFVINRLQQNQNLNDEATKEIITLFKQMRNEPSKPVNYRFVQNTGSDNRLATEPCNSYMGTLGCFCNIFEIILAMLFVIASIILAIITVNLGCNE